MLKLTEQEKQEVVRFLESGKELPEKYRFLLFEEKREVELVWNGKKSEVCNIVLPFQTIEQVDEPRAEKPADSELQMGLFDMDERGRQLKGWTNKLIWGDNKLILSSLKNGPLREEIEKQGGRRSAFRSISPLERFPVLKSRSNRSPPLPKPDKRNRPSSPAPNQNIMCRGSDFDKSRHKPLNGIVWI